jgi:aminopeptidase
MSIDTAVREGARNAVRVCMNVQPQDRVFVFTDDETLGIGQAFVDEAKALGAEAMLRRLEEYATRPITSVPPGMVPDVEAFAPTVTLYAASSRPGEVGYRMQLSAHLHRLNVRHGHMPSIDLRLMQEGMRADYHQVHVLTMQVFERMRHAGTTRVRSLKGTDLSVGFSRGLAWIPCHGMYHAQGDWGNLPEGEVYTCPAIVNGTVVADVLGDYFSPKYKVLAEPVAFQIVDSRVTRVTSDNRAIADEVRAYLDSAENGRRVGEFAIGTNTAVSELTGNLLQDEKLPGIHVAFGNPYPDRTGADWASTVHVDVIPTCCTIEVDGQTIMKDGEFQIPEWTTP